MLLETKYGYKREEIATILISWNSYCHYLKSHFCIKQIEFFHITKKDIGINYLLHQFKANAQMIAEIKVLQHMNHIVRTIRIFPS